jgi:hypothetical protein
MFTHQWIPVGTLLEMRRLVRSVAHLEGDIVEFGCWEGRSAAVLANAAFPELLIGVDHWKGSDTLPLSHYAPDGNVRTAFDMNIEMLTAGNVTIRDMSTRDFCATYDGPGVKFIHIDADHAYEQVLEDIRWALANTVPGGIVCGDDYKPYWDGVVRAVDKLVPNRTILNDMWVWQVPSADGGS